MVNRLRENYFLTRACQKKNKRVPHPFYRDVPTISENIEDTYGAGRPERKLPVVYLFVLSATLHCSPLVSGRSIVTDVDYKKKEASSEVHASHFGETTLRTQTTLSGASDYGQVSPTSPTPLSNAGCQSSLCSPDL